MPGRSRGTMKALTPRAAASASVLANTTMYAALIHSEPQSLKARLGVVGPRDSNGSEENTELP
jgi:hypothetical protein